MAQNAIGGPATIPEEYQPLDPTSRNIRLLELLPGKWTDELSCRMFVVSLDDDPYYEALSYVWGEPDLCRPIWINGSPRSITSNLDRALRRLRQPSRTRVMWIDALCINQSNVQERSHQVNMMGTIFSRTAEALLFLADYEEGRLLPDPGPITNCFMFKSIESVLALSGVAVDQVTMLGCCLVDPSRISVEIASKQWKKLLGYENIKGCQYFGGDTYENAFWRLLVYDGAVSKVEEDPGMGMYRRTVPGDFEAFLQNFELLFGLSDVFYYTHVFLGRFFITSNGYIGIGSRDTKIGDWIYVLHGGKVPFILRPVESQSVSRSFQYIGHAYVHGIMDGEAMQNPESQAEVVSLV